MTSDRWFPNDIPSTKTKSKGRYRLAENMIFVKLSVAKYSKKTKLTLLFHLELFAIIYLMKSDISDKNRTFQTMFIGCEAIQAPVNGCLVKHERESTRRMKDQFLTLYERVGGVSVSLVTFAGWRISRDTYYRWLKEDKQSKLRVHETEEQLNGIVEDLLLMKILKGDGAFIRFYLTRRHPKYMLRRSVVPVYSETRTLEDLLDERVCTNDN